jgi:hypothetical protein
MWGFQLRGKPCSVGDCMWNTNKLAQGCVLLGRAESNEGAALEDEEVAYFKGLSLSDFKKRKSAANKRIRALVFLHKFIQWLREHRPPATIQLPKDAVSVLRESRTLRVEMLGIKRSELVLLLDPNLFAKFAREFGRSYSTTVTQADALGLTEQEFCSLNLPIAKQ